MTHKRQSIRDAIVAALNADPGLSGSVFSMRTRPTQDNELPCVIVYATRETSELEPLNRSKLLRTVIFAIECREKAVGDIGAAIDDLCETVEGVMDDDPSFGRLARHSFLSSTQIGLDGEPDERQAVATLEYTVTYRTAPGPS